MSKWRVIDNAVLLIGMITINIILKFCYSVSMSMILLIDVIISIISGISAIRGAEGE